MNPVEKNCFTDVKNHSDKALMISIKFLFKDSKSGRKGEVPSLFNKKKSKYLQQFDSQGLPKSYQAGNGFYQISKASTFVQWAKKQRKTSQTSGFQLQIKKGIFQPMLHFWYKKELLNCQRPHLKPPSRDLARTVYTAENLFFTSFLQR
jgi:hypothetical protein